jgi:hypothetical protein
MYALARREISRRANPAAESPAIDIFQRRAILMTDHATFSALRLSRIFAADHLGSHPFYIEVDPEGDFDIEYLGGPWHEELIDGVQFFFPAGDGSKLGVVEVWGSGCSGISAVCVGQTRLSR